MTDSTFWDVIRLMFTMFVLVAYLMVMFHIVIDLFRDRELGGFAKALWFIFLIFLPFLTAIVYLIARGSGMADRARAAADKVKSETDAYIRSVAGKSPAEQITEAKALLDAGTINADEYAKLKARALG